MRRNVSLQWARVLTLTNKMDTWFLSYLRDRATLMAAVIGTLLIIWGLATRNWDVGVAVVVSGAVGYLLGIIATLAFGVLLSIFNWAHVGLQLHDIPSLAIQVLGYMYIAWLGREHRRLAIKRRSEIVGVSDPAQVVPWALVNEVRNSLLAMRLLLLSRNGQTVSKTELQLVQSELLRLESLFGNLKENAKGL